MCFLGVAGSHAYGMATSTSDLDLRGACIPPIEVRDSAFQSFEQWSTTKQHGSWGDRSQAILDSLNPSHKAALANTNDVLDVVVYNLTKLVRLAAGANPNILELVFLDDRDILHSSPAWELIRENRDLFLTRKCRQSYIGYANGQLKRIRTHRAWLLNPPKAKPERKDFGLPQTSTIPEHVRNLTKQSVRKIVAGWSTEEGFDDILVGPARTMVQERLESIQMDLLRASPSGFFDIEDLAMATLGLSKEVRGVFQAEKRYQAAKKDWKSFQKWQDERNPARAALEKQFGYDTKHGSHVVRLLRTGVEVLRDGVLRVRRPDADELLAIRRGAIPYEELLEMAESMMTEMKEISNSCPLPKAPDTEKIDQVLFEALRKPCASKLHTE